MSSKSSEQMRKHLTKRLSRFPSSIRKTITFDNGTENTKHIDIDKELGTTSYFCHPYHSGEKGSVENANGLIRQYIPKKTDIRKISNDTIINIEYALNNRPRKCLGYLTPYEAFKKSVALQV